MLADFCHDLWDTRVDSDTVSTDGYEVSNLVSRDKLKKQKGFLAARFVKPVVTVLLSFPFPVDVYAVNVNPQVGAQKTCGMEIHAASVKPRRTQNMISTQARPQANERHQSKTPQAQVIAGHCRQVSALHSYQYDLNTDNIKNEFKNLFVQILRVQIPEGKVGQFENHSFKHNSQVQCDSKIVRSFSDNVHTSRLQRANILHNVSHLVVRITQVHKGSVPCLGGLEVFGRPAQNLGTFVMDYARIITLRIEKEASNICNGLFSADCYDSGEPQSGSKTVAKLDSHIQNDQNSKINDIPDEFIDPITLNIMTIPVLLPSGTTIDHTTLEKHINSEKSWGRPPNDPFTGLPLGSKVIPNAALKYRIDKYLLSSNMSIGDLGRTVGSMADCRSTTKLKLRNLQERNMQKCNINKLTTQKRDNGETLPPLKRHKTVGVDKFAPSRSDSLDQALEDALHVRHQPAVQNKSILASSLLPNHESNLDTGSDIIAQEVSPGCPHQEKDTVLFQLPCKHVVCRACLTHTMQSDKCCPTCKKTFDKNAVSRVHAARTLP